MKYRKKPVVIEAIQFTWATINEALEFAGKNIVSEQREGIGAVGYFIKTLEGNSYILSNKDWIIKGVNGEFYPCKPDIFEKTYEKID
jgi:hypothetical protein